MLIQCIKARILFAIVSSSCKFCVFGYGNYPRTAGAIHLFKARVGEWHYYIPKTLQKSIAIKKFGCFADYKVHVKFASTIFRFFSIQNWTYCLIFTHTGCVFCIHRSSSFLTNIVFDRFHILFEAPNLQVAAKKLQNFPIKSNSGGSCLPPEALYEYFPSCILVNGSVTAEERISRS